MCGKILRFPDGAVLPQPVTRARLVLSVQQWVQDEMADDSDQRPQIVNRRTTAKRAPKSARPKETYDPGCIRESSIDSDHAYNHVSSDDA